MKEITRVHIAKISYDIETTAKKELETYITTLELYAKDQNIMEDIEIRMTELLAERGVQRGGVITSTDVASLRTQLGEPEDFAGDEVAAIDVTEVAAEGLRRRLYRDEEAAILGGVLSGIGKYFNVNPLWPRLVFLILLVGSFGTAFIIYIVLWLAIPVARTVAEKLELEGRPITLASIRERGAMSERAVDNPTRTFLGRAILFLVGVASLVVTLGALVAIAVVVFGMSFTDDGPIVYTVLEGYEWVNWLAMTCFVVSGLLLAALGVLLAYAAFARRFTRRFGIATVVIILTGLLSFGAGLATVYSGMQLEMRDIQGAMKETKVDLSDEFAGVTQLTATAHAIRSPQGYSSEMNIQYVVDSGKPRYVLSALPGVKADVDVKNGQARVVLKSSGVQNRLLGRGAEPQLTIYGPALDKVEVEQGRFTYTTAHQQKQDLLIETLPTTSVYLYGAYNTLSVDGSGAVYADSSAVDNLVADISVDGRLEAGVVRTFSIKHPDVCPADMGRHESRVTVQGVSSGKIQYNGSEKPAQTIFDDCGNVVIGSEDEAEGYES